MKAYDKQINFQIQHEPENWKLLGGFQIVVTDIQHCSDMQYAQHTCVQINYNGGALLLLKMCTFLSRKLAASLTSARPCNASHYVTI